MATMPTSGLITDRTALDVTNRTAKGFNSFADVKRVQDWVNYFIDEVNPSLPKYTWEAGERVDLAKWQTYILDNVKELLKSYPDLSGLSIYEVPTADRWDWVKQNRLEYILFGMVHAEPLIIKSFAEDNWKTIIRVANNKSGEEWYQVGDTKKETLSDGKNVTYTIKEFNKYSIENGIEKANICIEMDIDATYQMHGNHEDNEDWSTCDFRTKTIDKILNSMSVELKSAIKSISITSRAFTAEGVKTSDRLFPYSIDETHTNSEFWRRDGFRRQEGGFGAPWYLYFPYRYNGSTYYDYADSYKKVLLIFNI